MGLKGLEDAIKNASQRYYEDGTSPYTDEQFDSMLAELKDKKPDSELITSVGHGYDLDEYVMKTGKKKVKHKYGIVGSLDKAYKWDDLKDFLQYSRIYISLKLDGLSVVMYYKEGQLYQALTRGKDGYGIDVTDKVSVILGRTYVFDSQFTGAVRGEILMTDPDFELYKDRVDPEAKNSRNTAAGLINSKDVDEGLLKYLKIAVYSVVGVESIEFERNLTYKVDNLEEMWQWLQNNFVCVAPYVSGFKLTPLNYRRYLEDILDEFADEDYFPYDGLVLTAYCTTENSQVIYYSQAFKFGAESGETVVKNVEWNLTKTRYLMPKLNVEPLFLSGTNVENATGYNAQYIKENNIGVGTKLVISKHGEIIPNVDEILQPTEAQLPEICPVCGENLIWSGVHLQCPNEACGNAQLQDLLIWLENLAHIDFLGDKIKLKYLREWFDKDDLSITDVMSLKVDTGKIVGITIGGRGTQAKSVAEMLHILYDDNSRFPLVNVIKALNIPRFGDVNAEKLSRCPELIKGLYSAYSCYQQMRNLEPEIAEVDFGSDLLFIESGFKDKIGDANMKSLIKNISKFYNLRFIWNQIDWDSIQGESEFKGKVAITGKLSVKRADFEKELRSAGYEPKEISKDTKFLITDDPTSSSSKNKKADEWGIVKISEQEFRSKYL